MCVASWQFDPAHTAPLYSRAMDLRTVDSASIVSLEVAPAAASVPTHRISRMNESVVLGILSTMLYLYQLRLPASLSNYDTGVYVAGAIHFVHGVIPYRDFVLVQPPGLLYLLSPLTLFGIWGGAPSVLLAARVANCCISGLNVGLISGLIRQRGRLIGVAAGLAYGFLPVMIFETDAVKLEPLCTCLCLLALRTFKDTWKSSDVSDRQLLFAGMLFGAAATVKYWAVIPLAATTLVLLPSCRAKILNILGGAAGIFILLCSPFLVAAGGPFISQTLTSQLQRTASSGWDLSLWARIPYLLGSSSQVIDPNVELISLILFEVVLFVAVGYVLRRQHRLIETLVLVSAIASTTFLMLVPEWYPYYAAFSDPYLVLVAAFAFAGARDGLRRSAAIDRAVRTSKRLLKVAAAIIIVVLSVNLYIQWNHAYRSTTNQLNTSTSKIDAIVPPHSCFVTDVAYFAVEANRLATPTGCPVIVDSGGMQLAAGGSPSPPPKNLVDRWQGILARAGYVVLESPQTPYIPWTPRLTADLHKHFTLRTRAPGPFVYERTRSPAT